MLPNEREKNGCHTLCHQHEFVEICLKREFKCSGLACGKAHVQEINITLALLKVLIVGQIC